MWQALFYTVIIISLSVSLYNFCVLPWLLYRFSQIRCCDTLIYSLFIPGVLFSTWITYLSTRTLYRLDTPFRKIQTRGSWIFYTMSAIMLILSILIAFVGSFLLLLSLSAIPYGETLTNLNGLDGKVLISRGKNGSPTITAQTLRDAIFGQGYVHAQDRLSQLFLERAASRGEISTILGKSGISHDTMARTYNFNATAHAMCDGLSKFHRGLMNSYVNGINSYLSSQPVLPPDMLLYTKQAGISGPVEQWNLYDLCRAMVQYQTQLSSNCDAELKRWTTLWDAQSEEPYEVVEKLFPGQRHFRSDESLNFSTILRESDLNGPFGPNDVRMSPLERNRIENATFELEKLTYDKILKKNSKLRKHVKEKMRTAGPISSSETSACDILKTSMPTEEKFSLFQQEGILGSNAWVVNSPEMDRPMLANDPHLDMYLPGPWHYSSMVILSKNEWYTGATHVGLPGMCAGSSNFASWGLTLALTDICDLFIITRDDQRPDSYYIHKGERKAFFKRKEIIGVRGSNPIHLTIRETVYGPLLDNFRDSKVHNLAVWNAASQRNHATRSLESFLNFVVGIKSVEEMRDKVLHGIAAPALSIVMSDHNGNMGYAVTGLHPHRNHGHTGRYPIPGTGDFDHLGLIPMKELPWKIAPRNPHSKDFIIAANNKIYPDAYKYRLGYEFSSNFRAIRIGEFLESHIETSIDSMKELQLDSVSNIWLRSFRPWFRKNRNLTDKFPLLKEMVKEWDGRVNIGNRYSSVLWEYMAVISTKYRERYGIPKSRNVDPLLAYFLTTDSVYADLVEEGWKEVTAKEILPWGYGWGSLQLPHLSLSSSMFSCLGNRYPLKHGGDFTSVNMLGGGKATKSTTRHFGPSLRLVVETGKRVYYAIPGGFSENPFSEYYDNLLSGWSRGEYEEKLFLE